MVFLMRKVCCFFSLLVVTNVCVALYLSDVLCTSYNCVKDTAVYKGDEVAIFGGKLIPNSHYLCPTDDSSRPHWSNGGRIRPR